MYKNLIDFIDKNYPYLNQRKLSIFLVFLDFTIFKLIISNSNIFKNSVLDYLIFSIFWIVINYIFSQYKKIQYFTLKEILKKISLFIFANIFSYLLALISLTFISRINNIFFLNNFEIFYLSIFVSIVFCFYRLILMRYYYLFNSQDKVFGFWCSNEEFDEIKKIYLPSKYCLYDLQLINQLNFNSMVKKVDKIVMPNGIRLDKDLILKNNLGSKIINLTNWSEYILQRYPNKVLQNDDKILLNLSSAKKKFSYRLKNIIEILISLFLIILFSPLIFICGILIKLEDGGPIFYTQRRTGLNGKIFNIYKLRSMKINSEKNKAVWSSKNDKRVTRVGKMLRKSRIDELPQLFCVLKGDMSLIGPRPERPEFDQILSKKIDNYNLRHFIKPGISGWSQVSYPYGASIYDSEIKLSFDLYYIKNFSIVMDILVFFKTIRLVLRLENSNPIKP